MPPTQVVKQCQVIHTRLHSITSGTHIGGIFQHSGKLLETPDTPATGRVDQLATEIAKIFLLIEAFIYKDSQDRLIATTKEPKLQVGQTAVLKVSQVTRIGAFLDWGLEKDLLLPYHEQTLKVREGEDVLVALYIDKSSRLCATMKVYHYLSTRTPYVVGDMVKGRVYEISDRFGVFVAVDDKYSALIPAREAKGKYRPGKILELRVSEVKEDGKMNVTDRQKAYLQINEDAENVLEVINEFAGVLPFDDKASPEVIQREFGLSKGAFKTCYWSSDERRQSRD